MTKEIQKFWTLVEPYVKDGGFELCEIQWNREARGWVLRVFIERGAGAPGPLSDLRAEPPVSHADCERVSRDLSAALDVADLIPHAYTLEVSSPGLDRPLRRESDFSRFAGRKARVRLTEGIEGRRNFSGTILGAEGGLIRIECDGRAWQLPVGDLAKANLVPDWDAELGRRPPQEREGASP